MHNEDERYPRTSQEELERTLAELGFPTPDTPEVGEFDFFTRAALDLRDERQKARERDALLEEARRTAQQISGWHTRLRRPWADGTYNCQCAQPWPCPTRQAADALYARLAPTGGATEEAQGG